MPGYARDGSSWSTGPVRARTASGWTGEGDAGYVWDGTQWVKFQPDPSSLLPAPENLGVAATDTSAVASWTNPDEATTAGATDVQYRVPENGGGAWTELTYPATSLTLGFLRPETNYQLQVRYIIRSETDGTISDTGPIAEVFFTTDSLDGPGTLAPDPGGSGPDTVVPWGPTGNPGPVGGPGCWWEYVVQIVDTPVEGAISWSDTLVTDEFDGDAGSLAIDFVAEGLTCNGLGRWKYREVCDGTPGDWQFSDPFVIPCDWDTACGGNVNAYAAQAPYTDASIRGLLPHVCPIDGGASEPSDPTRIVDDITDQVFSKDSFFFGVSKDRANDVVVANSSAPSYGGPLISGYNSNLASIDSDSDWSIAGFVKFDSQPNTDLMGGTKVATFGRVVRIQAYAEGSGFTFSAIFPKEGGGAFQLNGTTEIALDTWAHWGLTIDADGNKKLYVNGVLEVTDADTTNGDFDGTGLTSEVALFGNAWARHQVVAFWNKELSAAEMAQAANPSALSAYSDHLWLFDDSPTTFPYADEINGNELALSFSTTITTVTSWVDGDPLMAVSNMFATASLGDDTTFDGLTFGAMVGMPAATLSCTGFDHNVLTFTDNNGDDVIQLFMDYTHPQGWNPNIRYWDSGGTAHVASLGLDVRHALSVDGYPRPFLVRINTARDTITVFNAGGWYQEIAVAGTGTVRCVDGVQNLEIGSSGHEFTLGRLGITMSELTLNEMVDWFWEMVGGIPVEYELGDYLTSCTSLRDHVPFVVPSGVSSVEIDVIGGVSSHAGSHPGPGDPNKMTVSKSVSPGDIIWLGQGGLNGNEGLRANIWGERVGQGAWLGAAVSVGADRSEIMGGSPPFSNGDQEVIAGAAGGCFNSAARGGDGGYPNGSAGTSTGTPGGGGTQVAGGTAGTSGSPGAAYQGAAGNNGCGGDGYFGGGSESYASSNPQAGGGGSGYFDGTSAWTLVSSGTEAHDWSSRFLGYSQTGGRIRIRMS